MGGIASKRIENMLLNKSNAFHRAVEESFSECHESLPQGQPRGIRAYQLLEATQRVYYKISVLAATDDGPLDDPVFGFQRLWLKRPPLQLDLDTALRISAPFQGLDTLDLESYTVFSATLFREMALSGLRHRWFLFVPAGAATGITLHTVLRRIPGVGEFVGPLASTAVIGSAVGAALALQA